MRSRYAVSVQLQPVAIAMSRMILNRGSDFALVGHVVFLCVVVSVCHVLIIPQAAMLVNPYYLVRLLIAL